MKVVNHKDHNKSNNCIENLEFLMQDTEELKFKAKLIEFISWLQKHFYRIMYW